LHLLSSLLFLLAHTASLPEQASKAALQDKLQSIALSVFEAVQSPYFA
jgi:hypothetical protein